jgi:hypothetical protein
MPPERSMDVKEQIERLEIYEGLESLGINVDLLLSYYSPTLQELRDMLKGFEQLFSEMKKQPS